MPAYWITPQPGQPKTFSGFCVEADHLEAAHAKASPFVPLEVPHNGYSTQCLPYPASPIKGERLTTIPDFCFKPNTCKGHTSCPRNPCCTN